MAFSEEQMLALSAKLHARHVRTREADGQTLAFIEGWHAIAEANRIFGFEGWDRVTLAADCVWSGTHRGACVCVYTAKVRVTVRAGGTEVTREGCGTGEGKGQTPGAAHDAALKAAETDATKRALATFGNPFGLALYDKELKGVRGRGRIAAAKNGAPLLVLQPAGRAPARRFDDDAAFAAALREALDRAGSLDTLYELWERNIDSVRTLARMRDTSKTADALVAHFKARAVAVARPPATPDVRAASSGPDGRGEAAGNGIDKSALALGEPKRLRSKAHLRYVASQPCLICGRRPAQAHHLRFAQPRAMARKTSDEYVVPLCALHHRELHAVGDEQHWWRTRKLDPLPVAEQLWREGGNGTVTEH